MAISAIKMVAVAAADNQKLTWEFVGRTKVFIQSRDINDQSDGDGERRCPQSVHANIYKL